MLPLTALVIVTGVYLAVDRGQGAPPVSVTAPTEEPAATEAAAPRLTPLASVCEGTLRRPDPKDPKSFPAEYIKRVEARGITVVANAKVSDEALAKARETIERMFASNDLAGVLADQGAYVIIADATQGVLDLPEFACLQGSRGDSIYDNVCGVADRADYPVATVNELDLTGNRRGPCRGLNILYHELGHLVQGWTLSPADYFDVRQLYQAALDAGKYRGEYAATNPNEYFAEATQAYFLHNEARGGHDRKWLKGYDSDLYELLVRIYGD